MSDISRRTLLAGGIVAAGTALGAALSKAGQRFGLVPPDAGGVYGPGETLAYASHRMLGRHSLAREFPPAMISAPPFANDVAPPSDAFKRHQAANFATWRLHVHGQVSQPVSLSVAQLRAMPVSSQITEVTCEEGWSYVAVWTGTPLASVLRLAGVRPTSRY